jgi:membrane-associated phospholipid phosphatase
MVGIWLSAIYTGHHYLLDVLAGILVCFAGIISFNQIIKRNPIKRWLQIYLKVIQ